MTGEKTLPILDAAHIRPFGQGGEHEVTNGLLLRTTGQRIATIENVQGKGWNWMASPEHSRRSEPRRESSESQLAVKIMREITSDLLNRLAPGFISTTVLG